MMRPESMGTARENMATVRNSKEIINLVESIALPRVAGICPASPGIVRWNSIFLTAAGAAISSYSAVQKI
ncbi:MAG: hypothetical protein K0Q90_1117 [Paenibacillaceae bacterium]|jgi:hypothetical protein|nr:hypothetical protein [Paenibacillaceae bacterium]